VSAKPKADELAELKARQERTERAIVRLHIRMSDMVNEFRTLPEMLEQFLVDEGIVELIPEAVWDDEQDRYAKHPRTGSENEGDRQTASEKGGAA
jgi:hypothetical protein